jgi:alkylation response protein AidB-like acyl-CoA dehydrogenase
MWLTGRLAPEFKTTDDYPISRIYRAVRYGTLGGGTVETLKDLVGKKLVADFDPIDGFLSMGTF